MGLTFSRLATSGNTVTIHDARAGSAAEVHAETPAEENKLGLTAPAAGAQAHGTSGLRPLPLRVANAAHVRALQALHGTARDLEGANLKLDYARLAHDDATRRAQEADQYRHTELKGADAADAEADHQDRQNALVIAEARLDAALATAYSFEVAPRGITGMQDKPYLMPAIMPTKFEAEVQALLDEVTKQNRELTTRQFQVFSQHSAAADTVQKLYCEGIPLRELSAETRTKRDLAIRLDGILEATIALSQIELSLRDIEFVDTPGGQ